jgi:hypothetical protein
MTSILGDNGENFNSSALLRSDHIAETPNLTSLPIPATHWDDCFTLAFVAVTSD